MFLVLMLVIMTLPLTRVSLGLRQLEMVQLSAYYMKQQLLFFSRKLHVVVSVVVQYVHYKVVLVAC